MQEVRGAPQATLGVLMRHFREGSLFRGIALEEGLRGDPITQRWAIEALDLALRTGDWKTLSSYFAALEDPKKISIWTALETLKALRHPRGEDSRLPKDLERTIRFCLYAAEETLIHSFEKGKIFALLHNPIANRFQIRTLWTLILLKEQNRDENEEAFLLQAQSTLRD
ncbi:MAG TPA: hypothetical protein ENK02_11425 [Planctomycetes bacterium]|nr:hypothetical protein [Planctomycetota bacterium]